MEETCSLMEAFDKMQLCYTLIPQVKNYYRYGEFKDCSTLRRDFNFCLSTKTKNKQEASEMIKQRNMKKNIDKFHFRSSAEVWELRQEPPPNFPPQL
jgi:hypothetical protein